MSAIDERRREICRGVSEAKSILIRIDSELYREGFTGSSRSLGNIIARLEQWEGRHT